MVQDIVHFLKPYWMKKIFTLVCFACFAVSSSYSQVRLPIENENILSDTNLAIMAPRLYETKKKECDEETTLRVFIPCDNSYYFFCKRDGVEYELLYVVGDNSMFLSSIMYTEGKSSQLVKQFKFNDPEQRQMLDEIICNTFRLWN